jgi:putative hydrolase of the HAD superfamily
LNKPHLGDSIPLKSENQAIEVIFFDLGFTLINFEGDFRKAMNESYLALARSLIKSGCKFNDHEFAKKYREIISNYYRGREVDLIERPVEESLHKTLAYFSEDHLAESVIEQAIAAMFSVTESYWCIESDVHETLNQLKEKGLRLGLISNASNTPDINRLIDGHGLRKYFDIIVISAEEKIRKPDARIFQRALNKIGVKPENAIMVGDTLTADILGAQQVGMRGIWIDRRAERPENMSLMDHIKPDSIIHDLNTLVDIVN